MDGGGSRGCPFVVSGPLGCQREGIGAVPLDTTVHLGAANTTRHPARCQPVAFRRPSVLAGHNVATWPARELHRSRAR